MTFAGIFFVIALTYWFQTVRALSGFRLDPFEDFITNKGYPMSQSCTAPLTTEVPLLSGPGDATLESPRIPYHLLGDYLEPGQERISNLRSEYAYYVDGEKRIEKTGNYGQVTNNYKRSMPDNGSTPRHELAVSFYKF